MAGSPVTELQQENKTGNLGENIKELSALIRKCTGGAAFQQGVLLLSSSCKR